MGLDENTVDDDNDDDALSWEEMYDIPLVHYSDRIMENMSIESRARWDVCLRIFRDLEADHGIMSHVVPVPYDPNIEGFWSGYSYDYVRCQVADGPARLELQNITAELCVGENGFLIPEEDVILVHHCDIYGEYKKKLLEAFIPHKWFVWNGSDDESMEICLGVIPDNLKNAIAEAE